jgi:hypothetical protein
MGAWDRRSQWRNRLLRTKEWSSGRFFVLGKAITTEGGKGRGIAMPIEEPNKEVIGREGATPSEHAFDEVVKGLADGTSSSRRQALRWMGGALIGGLGGLLAAAGPSAPSASAATVTTRIIIDGTVVKRTQDTDFTYSTELSRGCHTIRVVQRSSTGSRSSQTMRICCNSRISVVIDVEGTSVDMRATCL